jgi:hypothetical protein
MVDNYVIIQDESPEICCFYEADEDEAELAAVGEPWRWRCRIACGSLSDFDQ